MENYKLVIAYDGTNYSGWQVQPNATSIQSLIQDAIATIIREEITLIGSGRTDAGVHAIGQVAHFKSTQKINTSRLWISLNGILPKDIRVLSIESVPEKFHSQRSAISKTYHYHLHLDPVLDPFKRQFSYHVRKKIDLELLRKAAALFAGKHDFKSFANEAHKGAASKNSVRTLMRLDVVEEPGGIRLEFQADGFLYKMVRNIVGMLLDIASGKKKLEDIAEIFAAKDRRKASIAAPPEGLFLMAVEYPEDLLGKNNERHPKL